MLNAISEICSNIDLICTFDILLFVVDAKIRKKPCQNTKRTQKIGKKYSITREAVRQGLNKAISLIKESINV